MPSRRRFLAGASGLALPALAGCQSLDAESLAGNDSEYEYALSLDRVDSLAQNALWRPAEDRDRWSDERRDAWRTVTDGGAYATYGYTPIPDDEYTERDGTYYALSTEVTSRKRIERSVLRLRWVGREDDLDDPPDATPVDDLPPFDGNAAMLAYFAARGRHSGGGAPWDAIERGGVVYRNAEGVESELVPEPDHEYLKTHGTVLRVDVVRRTLSEPEHTTTARKVADSPEEFAAVAEAALVDSFLDTYSLSAEETEILREARSRESYAETTPLSDAYRGVLEALELEGSLYFGGGEGPDSVNRKFLKWQGDHYRFALYVNDAE